MNACGAQKFAVPRASAELADSCHRVIISAEHLAGAKCGQTDEQSYKQVMYDVNFSNAPIALRSIRSKVGDGRVEAYPTWP